MKGVEVSRERKKSSKPSAAAGASDDDSVDVVDFGHRRRAWLQTKQTRSAALGPFYLGRKEFLLRDWRRLRDKQRTGWDDAVKDEEVGLVKRVIDNWRQDKKEREDADDPSRPPPLPRMRMQTLSDGVPTITRAEIVAPPPPPPDLNGERKRKRDDDAADSAAPAPSPSKNGAHSAASGGPSRPSIPKVARPPMVNGAAAKGAAAGGSGSTGARVVSAGNNRVGAGGSTPH